MDSKIIQQNESLQEDVIEKHGQGKFEGFRFYANTINSDQTINTQNLRDNEHLILAFSKRAARFCNCANGDLSLSCDGIIRWIGQPVGQLVATEDFLKPKPIILADTQLTGEARNKVVQRLERFVTFHFTTTLKPLFDLLHAHHLTDLTSDLALKLVHSLGVLPRQEISELVKSLDQESRSMLRRLGVRFGAFHIYVTGMLKPASVQTIMLLWNLKNTGQDQTGLNEILSALSAGRTSLIVEPSYNRQFYSLAGYRILGQRAVRVDILERLANLIRPTLHWKKDSTPKPDGAYDGKSFFVTPTMMSILGANGTDMEEILKGLGYQSQTITRTVFEQNQLAYKDSPHMCTTDIPAAEWVGSPWQDTKRLPNTQVEKNLSSPSPATQQSSTACLPAAEPVGNFITKKSIQSPAREDKVILLWRYNHHFHHHGHKNRDKSGQKWQNKQKKAFKKERNINEKSPQEATASTKPSYKSSSPHIKYGNQQSSKKAKHHNPDSPFAKLAALRDQLTKSKNTDILSSKEH
ncbi:hypothetical protein [Bartonella raoultii]|uniref:ATP-dependent helicase n=1 Tax=Bartonella raoultii TaxID=1457020 RepID=A0ABS7I8D0_9HYPH|nr:hypothetical protein [Bartonella raoultii]MBX4335859.1 hypothetical protein [Bartonella raoultii]